MPPGGTPTNGLVLCATLCPTELAFEDKPADPRRREANAAFTVALWNAYRSGRLVPPRRIAGDGVQYPDLLCCGMAAWHPGKARKTSGDNIRRFMQSQRCSAKLSRCWMPLLLPPHRRRRRSRWRGRGSIRARTANGRTRFLTSDRPTRLGDATSSPSTPPPPHLGSGVSEEEIARVLYDHRRGKIHDEPWDSLNKGDPWGRSSNDVPRLREASARPPRLPGPGVRREKPPSPPHQPSRRGLLCWRRR